MDDSTASIRKSIYLILVVVASSIVAGQIATVRSKTGEVPFLSANDRSRWCTISSLVDDGTFAIDRQVNYREPIRKRRVWYTIDMVQHRGDDGQQHYYSSKPPLYPTMLAGVYAVFKSVSGASLMDEPFVVGRWMLAIVNLVPLIGYFVLMLVLIERTGQTNFGRLLAAGAVTFGTLLLPFSVSINNHLPAAICSAIALACVLWDRECEWWIGLVAGLAGGLAAANELPALSMMCLWCALFYWFSGLRLAIPYVAGVILVATAFFATNYAAHGSLRPPYAHRGTGSTIGTLSGPLNQPPSVEEAQEVLQSGGIDVSDSIEIRKTSKDNLLEIWDPISQQRFDLRTGDSKWVLSYWDDWYEYPGTYWQPSGRTGVDKGEPSRAVYAMHALIGHHGIFSLTPIWVLSVAGAILTSLRGQGRTRFVCIAICIATIVCMTFYFARPLVDRNYGGVSCGFRWMVWFTPLWLWLLIPAADHIAQRPALRNLSLLLLAASVFSVVTSLNNPWQHPWIYRYWEYLDWIAY